MIPKIIHYCWFGQHDYPPLVEACIKSWKDNLSDWEFKKWDETNSPLGHPFVQKALKEKKYAYVADYVRCYALYHEGGIYLDTDIEIIKDLLPLLEYEFFAAYEDDDIRKINCAAFGTQSNHILLKMMLEYYDINNSFYLPIPQVLGKMYDKYKTEGSIILSKESFYPYNPYDPNRLVKIFMYQDVTIRTYGIHHWGYSWKFTFYEKVINKIKKIISS